MPLLSKRKISCFPGVYPLGGGVGALCDSTTFYNGVSLVNDPFVGGVPATGPIRIDTSGATNDAITATINFDPAVDETFSINTTLLSTDGADDFLFTLVDTTGTAYMRAQYIVASGFVYMECHDGTSTSFMLSNDAVSLSQNADIGFKLSGAAATKLITNTVDGANQTDTGTLNFTGVIFDKIVLATSDNSLSKIEMLLYNANSIQLGNTNFVGRLPTQSDPNGNKFFSDLGVPVEYTLSPQAPLTEYYPYYNLGFGWSDAYLVSDTQCAGNDLILIDGVAQQINGIFQHLP